MSTIPRLFIPLTHPYSLKFRVFVASYAACLRLRSLGVKRRKPSLEAKWQSDALGSEHSWLLGGTEPSAANWVVVGAETLATDWLSSYSYAACLRLRSLNKYSQSSHKNGLAPA